MPKRPESKQRHDGREGQGSTGQAPSDRLECPATDSLIEAYVDAELETGERRRIEAHLDSCAACSSQLELARRIRSELRELEPQSCPQHVTSAVLAHAEAFPTWRRRLASWLAPPRLWQPALALLLAAALGIGFWYSTIRGPARQQAAEVARAEAEVKLALAYLGRIGQRTGTAVGGEVLEDRVVAPIARSITDAMLMRPADSRGGENHAL
ncbi:MAG: hypothetical protein GY856_10680 [bacterium]|nr:hypothetical protein [bacterium]